LDIQKVHLVRQVALVKIIQRALVRQVVHPQVRSTQKVAQVARPQALKNIHLHQVTVLEGIQRVVPQALRINTQKVVRLRHQARIIQKAVPVVQLKMSILDMLHVMNLLNQ